MCDVWPRSPLRGRSTSPAAPGSSRVTCPATSPGLDRSAAHARGRAGARSRARRSSQGDALALPFADDAFDRVVSGHFYGHLDDAQRAAFLREARRVAPELVIVDASRERSHIDEEWSERVLRDGSSWEVYKRWFTPDGLARRARRRRGAARGTVVPRRPLAPVSRARSIAALQRGTRAAGGASRRASRSTRGPCSPAAPASARISSASRPGRVEAETGPAVAGTRGPHAPPLAPARGGRRSSSASTARPSPAAFPGRARAGAATDARRRPRRRSAHRGARTSSASCAPRSSSPSASPPRCQLLGVAAAHRRDREELPARRRDRRPAAAPVRRERLAQRRGQPRAARQGADPRPPRARAGRGRIGSSVSIGVVLDET